MIHKIKNASLQTKIMMLLMLMSTLLSITLGVVFYQNTAQNTLASKEKEMLTLASLTANKIERFYFERSADAKVLSQSQIFTMSDVTQETRLQYLNNVIKAYKTYDAILIFDTDGHITLRAGALPEPIENDLMKLQSAFLNEDNYISDIRLFSGDKFIYFAEPLLDDDKNTIGTVVEIMNFRAIDTILSGIVLGETGYAYLRPPSENATVDDSSIQMNSINDKSFLTARVPVIKYPSQTKQWYVTVTQSTDEALLVKKDIEKYFFYVVLGFLALFYAFSAIISHHVTLPIRLLMEKTNSLIASNQKFASDVIISDEVKNLANSFDLLLEELHFMMQRVLEKSGEAAHIDLIRDSIDKLIEGMPSGIITVDQNGKISSINEPALSILKIQREDIIGKVISAENPVHLKPLFNSISDMVKSQKTLHDAVCELNTSDKHKIKIIYSILVQYDSHNNFIGLTVLLNLLDAKRNFEESILRAKKLSELGELAAGVAHEVRNPLASIRGYAQLVHREMADNTQAREDIDIILHEVDRLDNIIDRFLTFARPNAPKLGLYHMNDIIEDTIRLIGQDKTTTGIELRHRFTKQDLVRVDYEQMKQVLINLILNAVQAMPKGGHIDLVTVYSEVSGTMEIHIADEGEGIPPELIDKIFTPFYTTRDNGSGLGLSICSRIIENHSGIMEITSSKEGTRIIIKLPVEGLAENMKRGYNDE